MTNRRKIVGLVTAGVLTGLLIGEVGYRIHHYRKLLSIPTGILTTPQSFYEFDAVSGYRYAPKRDMRVYWWGEGPTLLRSNLVRTNNQGHVSSEDDSVKKGHEFRIAVVGDSLSACIHNEDPWPDILQRELNGSPLRKRVNGKRFNVINFSRDGIGVEQFPNIIENEVRQYQPDLILVNFITADIYRRFIWRGEVALEGSLRVVLTCNSLPVSLDNPECAFANNLSFAEGHGDPNQVARVASRVARLEAKRKPWLTPYPQLASVLMGGATSWLLGRNPFSPRNATIENREESIAVTTGALKEIAGRYRQAKLLHLPVYWEIVKGAIPKLTGEVMRAASPVEITPMVMYLPQNPTQAEVDHWTHFPSDMHFSDAGARVYAQSVKQYLEELFRSRRQGDGLS